MHEIFIKLRKLKNQIVFLIFISCVSGSVKRKSTFNWRLEHQGRGQGDVERGRLLRTRRDVCLWTDHIQIDWNANERILEEMENSHLKQIVIHRNRNILLSHIDLWLSKISWRSLFDIENLDEVNKKVSNQLLFKTEKEQPMSENQFCHVTKSDPSYSE